MGNDEEAEPVSKCGLKPGVFERLLFALMSGLDLTPGDREALVWVMGLAFGQEQRIEDLKGQLARERNWREGSWEG